MDEYNEKYSRKRERERAQYRAYSIEHRQAQEL
jgi:hypothetical protein